MRNLCSLLTHNKKLVVFSWQKSVGLVQDFLSANSNPILHEQPTEKKSNDKLYCDADTHTPKANPKRWEVSRKQNSTVASVKARDSPNNRNQWMQMSKGPEISATEFWRQRRNCGQITANNQISSSMRESPQGALGSAYCLIRAAAR